MSSGTAGKQAPKKRRRLQKKMHPQHPLRQNTPRVDSQLNELECTQSNTWFPERLELPLVELPSKNMNSALEEAERATQPSPISENLGLEMSNNERAIDCNHSPLRKENSCSYLEGFIGTVINTNQARSPSLTQHNSWTALGSDFRYPRDKATFRKTLSNHLFDSEALDLYDRFKLTGSICYCIHGKNATNDDSRSWQSCSSLFNAYMVGAFVRDYTFANRIMDVLAAEIPPGIPADFATIRSIFTEDTPSQLQQFVVDRCLDADAPHFQYGGPQQLPRKYLLLALETAVGRLSAPYSQRLPAVCRYHIKGGDLELDIPVKRKELMWTSLGVENEYREELESTYSDSDCGKESNSLMQDIGWCDRIAPDLRSPFDEIKLQKPINGFPTHPKEATLIMDQNANCSDHGHLYHSGHENPSIQDINVKQQEPMMCTNGMPRMIDVTGKNPRYVEKSMAPTRIYIQA